MREIVEWSLSTWKMYWGEGFYQYLLLAASVYLLIFRRKKAWVRYLLVYLTVIFVVFLFPVTAFVIQKCIGASVFWRVLWLLPAIPVIALSGAELIKERKSRGIQLLLLCLFCAAAAIGGESILSADNYVKVHNYQKVPDEAAQICEMIKAQTGEREVSLATDDHLASYIRVYDPSIKMPYGRAGRGARSTESRELYQQMIAPEPDMSRIARLARKRNCNYVALKLRTEQDKEPFYKAGYEVVGAVNDYTLFFTEKEK